MVSWDIILKIIRSGSESRAHNNEMTVPNDYKDRKVNLDIF